MTKPKLASILGFAMAALALCARAEDGRGPFKVGFAMRRFAPPEPYDWRGAHTRALVTSIWYPADTKAEERPQLYGPPESPLFEGGNAAPGGAIASHPEKLPLILLSHGTGGSAQSIAWLATALASEGYVVAGANHPGNTALEPYTTEGFSLWWLRAQDLSAITDAMLADAEFGARLDQARVGAAGFSLGGYTMMAIAGGVTSMSLFQEFCTPPRFAKVCKAPPEFPDIAEKSKALAESDPRFAQALREAGKSYRDLRVRAVFAIAPALAQAFTPESLKAISIPVAIVAGEGDPILPLAINAKQFASLIPNAALTVFPGAVGHYTFLDRCTDAGRQAMPGLCVDAPGVDRGAVHRSTVELAAAFFSKNLR